MVRNKFGLGLAALVVAAGVSTARAEMSQEANMVQRIVVFSKSTPRDQRVSVAQALGAKVVRELGLIDAVVVRVPQSQISIAEAGLKSRADVLRIDEDPRINWLEAVTPARVTDVTLPGVKETLKAFAETPAETPPSAPVPAPAPQQETPWGIARVNAAAAWGTTRGQGVKVAVIDTGIDMDHPDLKANVVGGWNAITKTEGNTFKDDNGHGTHVSGTIAALDDQNGVVGVAPAVSLYGVKVLDAGGSGTFSDVIAGMDWAVTNKMQVVNMSLGASKGNDSLKAAVENMAKAGVVLAAAAGNSGRAVGFPAAYPQTLCIAAMDVQNRVAYFSSRGPEVDFIAPGVDVKSTYMGGGYSDLDGTSMATPHMAGLAALAIGAKGFTDPEAVRAFLKAASTPLAGAPVEQQGAGVVDAAKLVK